MNLVVFILIGGGLSIPPAARLLVILAGVYAVILAAKQNPWIADHMTGWVTVLVNILLTALSLFLAVPADQLYSYNTVIAVLVGVLGSSGIHGMTQNVPKK